jgi:hypothetical protein
MNIIGAIVAGLIGTVVLSALMRMGPMMGMPKMEIPQVLGGMLPGGTLTGWVAHFMIGVMWAIIFAALWSAGIGSAGALWGLIFGVGAFVVAGLAMPMMLTMHPQVKTGTMPNVGILMSGTGMMGMMGSLMGHAVFGLVVGLIYGAF